MIFETWLPFCYGTILYIKGIVFAFFNLARVFIELLL